MKNDKFKSVLKISVCFISIGLCVAAMVFGMLYCNGSLDNVSFAASSEQGNPYLLGDNLFENGSFWGYEADINNAIVKSPGNITWYNEKAIWSCDNPSVSTSAEESNNTKTEIYNNTVYGLLQKPGWFCYSYLDYFGDLSNKYLCINASIYNKSDTSATYNATLQYTNTNGDLTTKDSSSVVVAPNTRKLCNFIISLSNLPIKLGSQLRAVLVTQHAVTSVEYNRFYCKIANFPIGECMFNLNWNFVGETILNTIDPNSASWRDGFNQGKLEFNQNSYNQGHADGFKEATNQGNSFINLANAVVGMPVTFFEKIFNFNVLGFNMSNIMFSMLTLCMFLVIINLVLRGRS